MHSIQVCFLVFIGLIGFFGTPILCRGHHKNQKNEKQHHYDYDDNYDNKDDYDIEPEPPAPVTPRPMEDCERTYDLEKEGPILLHPQESTCKWDIIGSPRCTPELSCEEIVISMSEECEEEYLKVTDGLGGEAMYCGKIRKWKKGVIASMGGRDLYISYSGPQRGVICTAKCSGGKKNTRLPVVAKPRKEEVGCVCGQQESNDRNRIVNGEDAKPNEFPWQVAMVAKGTNSPTCGASLINDRFILSAAHCNWFTQTKAEDIEVLLHAYVLDFTLLGDWKDVELGEQGSIRGSGYKLANRSDEEEGRVRLKVKKIINHPLFTEKYDYDVALFRLEEKLDLKILGISPICLPKTGDNSYYTGQIATVAGWGKSDEVAGSTTRKLQKLDVPVLAQDDCADMMNYDLTDRMMCAGYKKGGRDACSGDSGGPLIVKKKNSQFVQIGVVSWGEGCARKDRPGVYSRLTDLNQWIQHHAREADAVWCSEEAVPAPKKQSGR